MAIQMNPELAKKLNDGMKSGDAITLPFSTVYTWALNGQSGYKKEGSAMFFGGWACKADDLDALTNEQGMKAPLGWTRSEHSSREGDSFDIYATRHVIVAPFGKRVSFIQDGKRLPHYVEGSRRHLQVLAYLAEKHGENGSSKYDPWGPVVLTAKGYQAQFLLKAFTDWDKATSALRRKVAPGVPAWCFYLALGTFEKERNVIMVGKQGAQSPITPVSAYIPQNMTEAKLESLYVGETTAAIMADLMEQSAEWLKAWSGEQVEHAEQVGAVVEDDFSGLGEAAPF